VTIESINSNILKNMFIAGAKYLESKKRYVDELNVFPVPDGDTGTNMTLTILAAAREVEKADGSNMAEIAKAISSGSLRGARGNSGVILSQIFRGFAREIANHDELDTVILANAMAKGSETAYKAVMKPKEGTILTVARAAAEKAAEIAIETTDVVEALREVIKYADEVLEQTPEMLPVLKEAGVVDAGGQGFIYILKGALMALENGTDVTLELEFDNDEPDQEVNIAVVHANKDIKFGYCTEFIVDTGDKNTLEENEEHATTLKRFLATIGDSIVAVADDDLIKIHVHTNDPGRAMQHGLTIGQLMNIKVDNMRLPNEALQHEHKHEHSEPAVKEKPFKENAFIAVSVGEGMNNIFESVGADYVVTGGQTMNPSTDDFLTAIENLNAKNIYIFPNNKNIILAASQVCDLIENKNIIVIPSKTAPQGIISLISFDPILTVEENVKAMNDAIGDVKTGQITFAVRDTSIDSIAISEGDYLGISDDGIKAVDSDLNTTVKALLDEIMDNDSELVTLYYGEDIDEASAKVISSYIEDKYEDVEVEIHYGGQPLYYFIISVE